VDAAARDQGPQVAPPSTSCAQRPASRRARMRLCESRAACLRCSTGSGCLHPLALAWPLKLGGTTLPLWVEAAFFVRSRSSCKRPSAASPPSWLLTSSSTPSPYWPEPLPDRDDRAAAEDHSGSAAMRQGMADGDNELMTPLGLVATVAAAAAHADTTRAGARVHQPPIAASGAGATSMDGWEVYAA